MKKYLFILAGLLCFVGQGDVQAKAVKLGREAVNRPCTGTGCRPGPDPENPCNPCTTGCKKEHVNLKKPNALACYCNHHPADRALCGDPDPRIQCSVNCLAGKCEKKANGTIICRQCRDGMRPDPNNPKDCIPCTTITVPNCTVITNLAAGRRGCDPSTGKVTDVQLNNGLEYTNYINLSLATEHSNTQNVCPSIQWGDMTCKSGFRAVKNGNDRCCVPICAGVSCQSGYVAKVKDGKCCCQKKDTGNCTSWNGTTCTACATGYCLKNNKCVKKPDHATCNSSNENGWVCSNHYYQRYFPTNGSGFYACLECPYQKLANGTKDYSIATCPSGSGNSQGFTCNQGYFEELIERDGSEGGAYWSCSPCSKYLPGCAACDAEGTTCTACASGYRPVQALQAQVCKFDMVCTGQFCKKEQVCVMPANLKLTCQSCSSISEGCTACTAGGCTACESGKYLAGSSGSQWAFCATCPDHATCNGTSTVNCGYGYIKRSLPVNGAVLYMCDADPSINTTTVNVGDIGDQNVAATLDPGSGFYP